MSAGDFLLPWTEQPQGLVTAEPNFANPLCRGLVTLWNAASGTDPWGTAPNPALPASDQRLVSSAKGLGRPDFAPQIDKRGISGFLGAKGVTVFALIRRNSFISSDSTGSRIVRHMQASGSNGIGLIYESFSNRQRVSFEFFLPFQNPQAFLRENTQANGSIQRVVGLASAGGNLELRVEDLVVAGPAVGESYSFDLLDGGRFFAAGGANSTSQNGLTYLTATWNRRLSEGELAELWQNPWQLFAPRLITAGSTGAPEPEVPFLSLPTITNLGANTVRLGATLTLP